MSVDSGGAQGDSYSHFPSISEDGRYVAFGSAAANLVTGDTNNEEDIFVHDRQSAATTRVSVDSGGMQGNSTSTWTSLSSDGRYVAFMSSANNLVPGDSNGEFDVFVNDRGPASAFPASCFGDGSDAPCGCGNEASPGSGGGCLNGPAWARS